MITIEAISIATGYLGDIIVGCHIANYLMILLRDNIKGNKEAIELTRRIMFDKR